MSGKTVDHDANDNTGASGNHNQLDLPPYISDILQRIIKTPTSEAHLPLARKSMAGVLILLCLNSENELCVILTTRALTMRSFPGETALPGGRMEEHDETIVDTALREAQEEIGLDLERDSPDLQILHVMEPFLAKNLLFVAPVVAFTPIKAEVLLTNFKPNPSEVGAIWSWPLKLLLGQEKRSSRSQTSETEHGLVEYSYRDVNWLSGKSYRLHEFQSAKMGSPITGLTADILLEIALIAYNVEKPHSFERYAKNQLSKDEMIKLVLAGKAGQDGDTRSSLRRGQRVTEDTVAATAAANAAQ